jgi:flagellar hook protein FlgE
LCGQSRDGAQRESASRKRKGANWAAAALEKCLMTTMGSAVSGMLADTNWLSSISQNVANADTTGYKDIETEFSTAVGGASDSAENVAGVTTSVRSMNALQGSVVGTSTTTDLAVQGAGYFVVADSSGTLFLTRNGSFVPDVQGNLVNASGYYLMGYSVDNGETTAVANSLSGVQKVNVTASGQAAIATTTGTLGMNLPAAAAPTAPADLPSTNSATAKYTDKTSLVTYSNLGGAQNIDIYVTKSGADTWEVDAYDNSAQAPTGGFPYSSGPLATQTLAFSPTTGALTGGSPFSVPVPNGQTMSLDLSATTQLASSFNVNAASANGNAPASMTGVTVGPDGTLSFQYASGSSRAGYQIPLASVASPDGMTSENGNAYLPNYLSGQAYTGEAGTSGFGTIASSSLENSTVDIATELTNMIQAQSAYEANSKVFQTGATILDVLNGLKA